MTNNRTKKKAPRKASSSSAKKAAAKTGKASKPKKKVTKLTPEQRAARRIAAWKRNPYRADQHSVNRYGATTALLDLSNLGLSKLPEGLRELKGLELLFIYDNRLEELPHWIGELTELRGIGAVNNRIRTLPDELRMLTKLRALGLSNNALERLPDAIRSLNLAELHLGGNERLELPESIANSRSPKEILRYYFESLDEKGRPLLELKLLLVGRGKAGKTTLVKQLAGEPPDKNESETHSISIRELTFSCPRGAVRTRAWDFGGQEILHSTHQFFLTERSLYLLVLEPRTGLAQRDAEYWLKLIETQGGASPVIVIMNWSTGRGWNVDEIKLRRKFPFVVDFLQTDALRGEGIQELRTKIHQVVEEQMTDVWLPFPVRWREIKDAVAGMKDNFLTYSQYVELCEKHGEADPIAQGDLAGILHALGLALYFGRDPRLHDTRVLNPGWVTGGVYSVIRAQSVLKNDGQLTLSDMPKVLREAQQQGVVKTDDYPPNTHRFILELMRAFQLCYASEEEKGKAARYLVPELLPEFEPQMKENWEKAPIRLRYRYEVLPPGFLPRFIVRTHALSEGAPHWRHGVVLQHAGAVALIREETDRPELQVFVVGGDTETRQVLIAIVRRELEALHSDMKMQPVEELELTGEGEQWISVKALQQIERPKTRKQQLPIQPEGTAEVDVPGELNKLGPEEARAIDRNPKTAGLPVRLFVSYAHDDERQLKRLDAMLDILEQQHGLTSWTDKRLIAGAEWDAEIRKRLEEMDIFLFIASQASLVRPYIKDPELRRAKERYEQKEVRVVTVKLEPCASDDHAFLGKLQRLASRFSSIAETNPRSKAWEKVRLDLLPVIKSIRETKSARNLPSASTRTKSSKKRVSSSK